MNWRGRHAASAGWGLAALLGLASATQTAQTAQAAQAAQDTQMARLDSRAPEAGLQPARPREKMMPLEVTVNGAKAGTWVMAERDGVLYAPQEAMQEWRVRTADGMAWLEIRGSRYWPLPRCRVTRGAWTRQRRAWR